MSRFADEVQMRRCAGVVQCFKIRTGIQGQYVGKGVVDCDRGTGIVQSCRGIDIVEVCWKAGVVKR